LGTFHLHGKITLAVGEKVPGLLGSAKVLQIRNAQNHKGIRTRRAEQSYSIVIFVRKCKSSECDCHKMVRSLYHCSSVNFDAHPQDFYTVASTTVSYDEWSPRSTIRSCKLRSSRPECHMCERARKKSYPRPLKVVKAHPRDLLLPFIPRTHLAVAMRCRQMMSKPGSS